MLDSLLCVVVKVLSWLVCHLPPSAVAAIGTTLGRLGYWLQPTRAQIGYANLTAAFGERFTPSQRRQIVRRVFGNLGAGAAELLRLPAIDAAYIERYVPVERFAQLEEAARSGRAVILLTAHYGNWELSSIVGALKGYPIVALARAQQGFPKLYQLLVSYRESKGCRIVHKGSAMRKLIRALDKREMVGIVGDQTSRQGLAVDFFGRPALFATGPFQLAYTSKAVILPVFIHRVRGPSHRIVIDVPPIDLSTAATEDDAVRAGITQFAARLTRHIEEDPAQWLWIHKRWKHTAARRVVILSDGKLGHVKQSLTVVAAYRERYPETTEQLVEVRYRSRLHRLIATWWASCIPGRIGSTWVMRTTLEPACAQRLAGLYADVVISCGSSVAPINVLLAADLSAKSVVIMNPAPIPLRKFTTAFVPVHDAVTPRPSVIQVDGALAQMSDERLRQAKEHVRQHERFRPVAGSEEGKPWIAVFLGGATPEYQATTAFVEALCGQVLAACEELDGYCVVTTSRRTPEAVERWLRERLGQHPRCRALFLAGRDALNGTLEGMLGWAQVVVVTAESISMVSEACASGRYVLVVEPPLRQTGSGPTKPQRYLRQLIARGYARQPSMPEVGHMIRHLIRQRPAHRRLDTYTIVRDAIARLL